MRSRTGMFVAGGLIVALVLLAACEPAPPVATPTTATTTSATKPAAPTSPAATTTATATPAPTTTPYSVVEQKGVSGAEETPQYGGWAAMIPVFGTYGAWDPSLGGIDAGAAFHLYQKLVIPDWARGPAGTNEHPHSSSYVAEQFWTGLLAESWETTDLMTFRFHIRKGVNWQNKAPVNGREMDAYDVEFSLKRDATRPNASATFKSPPLEITAIDKWTVVISGYAEPQISWTTQFGVATNIVPHEVVEKFGDLKDWKNAVGTGPFMLTDFVSGSSATYTKNPNYWEFDPVNKQNRLPYIDGFRELYVEDWSTRLAALRTGKIDRLIRVPWNQGASMRQTNPELNWIRYVPTSQSVFVRSDTAPFSDLKVRQALMLAIDHQSIVDDFYQGNAALNNWPIWPAAVEAYTPVDQQPAANQELFSYNPDKAKQLLAEAGYPGGFNFRLMTYTPIAEVIQIVKAYWHDIGVEAELFIPETNRFFSMTNVMPWSARDYVAAAAIFGNSDPVSFLNRAYFPNGSVNWSVVNDAKINEYRAAVASTIDPVQRAKLVKEAGVYAMSQLWVISLPQPVEYLFWQPWLKNYRGEVSQGSSGGYEGFYQYVWIDQALRARLTGR